MSRRKSKLCSSEDYLKYCCPECVDHTRTFSGVPWKILKYEKISSFSKNFEISLIFRLNTNLQIDTWFGSFKFFKKEIDFFYDHLIFYCHNRNTGVPWKNFCEPQKNFLEAKFPASQKSLDNTDLKGHKSIRIKVNKILII